MFIEVEQAGVTLLDAGDWSWEYDADEKIFVHERKVIKKTLEEVLRDHGPVTVAIQTVHLQDYEDFKETTNESHH